MVHDFDRIKVDFLNDILAVVKMEDISVKEVGGLMSVTLSCEDLDGVTLLHKVVWCFFLHFLPRNLDWHCNTL